MRPMALVLPPLFRIDPLVIKEQHLKHLGYQTNLFVEEQSTFTERKGIATHCFILLQLVRLSHRFLSYYPTKMQST